MPNPIIKFDSVDLSEYFATWQETANSRINAMTVPKRHGALVSEAVVEEPRIIAVTGSLLEPSGAEALRNTLDTLAELFARRNKRLQLWDDRYINAYKSSFQHSYIPGSAMRGLSFSLEFFCADPFWYPVDGPSSQTQNLSSSDTLVDGPNGIYKKAFTLSNDGTTDVFIKTLVTASNNPLTKCLVRNLTTGRMWTYTGTVAASKTLEVNALTFDVKNDGTEDLANWQGDFLYLKPGINNMEIEGKVPASYFFEWTKRWY